MMNSKSSWSICAPCNIMDSRAMLSFSAEAVLEGFGGGYRA